MTTASSLVPIRLATALLLGAALALPGCSTAPRTTPAPQALPTTAEPAHQPDPMALERARDAEARGDLVVAALEYRALARSAPAPWRERLELKAAAALARGGYLEQARQITAAIDPATLEPESLGRLRAVEARIALHGGDPQGAIEQLPPEAIPALPVALQREHHHLRAEAFELLGNLPEAIRERASLDTLLEEGEERWQNASALWQDLMRLDAEALRSLIAAPPPDPLSGWLELAYLIKRDGTDPALREEALEQWRQRYPGHGAAGELLERLLAEEEAFSGRPGRIALLLPLSGPFAAPAQAVRDGFLAAHYAEAEAEEGPEIRIYDTGGDEARGLELYRRAIAEGAEMVVGPLDKRLVERLVREERIETPTLALNYARSENSHPRLFQFGLLPEDEARQVAERAWLDGHDRALVLVPEGEWGERMGETFARHWQRLSGTLLERQDYDPGKNDFGEPVQKLLNIDRSKARHRQLQKLLDTRLGFEPRRRQDADFIFTAAFPRQARQIRPQLKFFYAADLPVYATSHAYAGSVDTTLDRDMDGILFCDMPWVLGTEQAPPRWETIERLWPSSAHAFKRLYAMGIDAYRLIPSLRYLRTHPQEHFRGATGNLYLDGQNRVHRQLVWARFKGGRPRPQADPSAP